MINHLFPNFLNDDDEYRRSKEFWSQLCDDVLREYDDADDWTTASRDQFREGNPILDWKSPSTQKGISIVQEEPRSSEIAISAWTDTRGGDPGEAGIWDELVIYGALSEESAQLARQLLIEWVQFEGPRQAFEPTIARILGW